MAIGAGCGALGGGEVEKVELEAQGGEEVLVVTVRPTRWRQGRCERCDRRAPRYDNGEGSRRWRGLDAGTTRVCLRQRRQRVSCPVHGVIVAAVLWARHGSRFTSAFETPRHGAKGKQLLAGWPSWTTRSRLPEFVAPATTIKRYLPLIHNTLEHGISNAVSEATNTHPRLLTRRAYGYHSADALIAIATLTRGGLCPPLPGRS